jgi:hypothetical protein
MRLFRRGDKTDRAKSDSGEATADPFAMYTRLRGIPLGEHGGPADPFEGSPIIAVILDWGQTNGAATVAAMADGTTSLYTSTGGGVIGAGAHTPVRDANRRLMQVANEHLNEFGPTTEAPIPARDHLAIVIRTSDGLRRAEASYVGVQRGIAHGQAVFNAANDVLTAIHLVTPAQERATGQA